MKLDNLQQVAIWLIKTLCLDTNATEANYEVKGLNHLGKEMGDYKITIKRL